MASIADSCTVPLIILMALKLQLLLIVRAEPQVPCHFVFGDSLVDNGNNNFLYTQAKVNYPPYGTNFPGGNATGRFSNGENLSDATGKLLGFANYTPPYVTARGKEILQGVNYGSGGAGIRVESGQNLGGRISLDQQLRNHGFTVLRLVALQRNISHTKEYLGKCIYTVAMGSNDYNNNYFMPHHYPTSKMYTPDEYADVLIQQYSQQLESLYDAGARKVAVFGLGLLGCTPAQIYSFGYKNASGCVDKVNDAVALFNERMKPLVDGLNTNLTHAKFIYINTTHIAKEYAGSGGFTVLSTPCCVASLFFGKGQCEPNLHPCSNPQSYIFWDDIHPTEKANKATAERAYMAASPLDSYPMDIRTLALQ
ncbi:GDSL-like Lipase/Acylhydrolase superfamily protein [Heracleum sosnowskyi]|uniref:GDSL-like Lipase/Acylhydrolase superfamily protein n=1 Tax=Heracleum sosnowskyi TaxID=360622 RepID=A0AAD8MQX2_9APIA|nr:GDSL-like Lipase/Acylhydrolase superfamily protein [Heracleum sosnowskyi]